VVSAAARQTSVVTPTLDDPAQHSAGAQDQRDRLRLLELTDRLHRAIERQKRYPLSARRLGREGTASVAFRLRPDGAIDDLEVAATSGEPALDRAALRAVSGISPFGEARAYLDSSAPFRVDIAFRLH
jgi:protein TonB